MADLTSRRRDYNQREPNDVLGRVGLWRQDSAPFLNDISPPSVPKSIRNAPLPNGSLSPPLANQANVDANNWRRRPRAPIISDGVDPVVRPTEIADQPPPPHINASGNGQMSGWRTRNRINVRDRPENVVPGSNPNSNTNTNNRAHCNNQNSWRPNQATTTNSTNNSADVRNNPPVNNPPLSKRAAKRRRAKARRANAGQERRANGGVGQAGQSQSPRPERNRQQHINSENRARLGLIPRVETSSPSTTVLTPPHAIGATDLAQVQPERSSDISLNNPSNILASRIRGPSQGSLPRFTAPVTQQTQTFSRRPRPSFIPSQPAQNTTSPNVSTSTTTRTLGRAYTSPSRPINGSTGSPSTPAANRSQTQPQSELEILTARWRARYGAVGAQSTLASSSNATPIPPSRAHPANAPCSVCLDPPETYPLLPPTAHCTHKSTVCGPCLEEYISNAVNTSGSTTVSCPDVGCRHTMEYADVMRGAKGNKACIERYERLLLRRTLESEPNFVWCKNATCGWGQLHESGAAAPIVICQTCRAKSCFTHDVPWHTELTCAQYDARQNRQTQDNLASEQYITANAKTCPNASCGRRIEKTDGCDHMTCRPPAGCGHQFCWICLADYNTILRQGNHRHNTDCRYYAAIDRSAPMHGRAALEQHLARLRAARPPLVVPAHPAPPPQRIQRVARVIAVEREALRAGVLAAQARLIQPVAPQANPTPAVSFWDWLWGGRAAAATA